MVSSTIVAEMEQVSLDLVICTRQPGRLRLSKHACALRYLAAQKGKPPCSDDEFGLARAAGLAICRDCPEGRNRAAELQRD
jgi:hypothetical protein